MIKAKTVEFNYSCKHCHLNNCSLLTDHDYQILVTVVEYLCYIWAASSEKVPSQIQIILWLGKVSSELYTMILLADGEDPDQTVWMCRLIWAFTVHTCPKTGFNEFIFVPVILC